MIDLHTHTTASDGRCTPAELVARAAAAGVTVLARHRPRHRRRAATPAAAACAAAGIEFVAGIEITAVRDERRRPRARLLHRRDVARAARVPRRAAAAADRPRPRDGRRGSATLGITLDVDAILAAGARRSGQVGRPAARSRARSSPADTSPTPTRRSSSGCARGRPAFVPRVGAAPAEVFAQIHEAGGRRVARASRPARPRRVDPGRCAAGSTRSRLSLRPRRTSRNGALSRPAARDASNVAYRGGSDYHADDVARSRRTRAAFRCRVERLRSCSTATTPGSVGLDLIRRTLRAAHRSGSGVSVQFERVADAVRVS